MKTGIIGAGKVGVSLGKYLVSQGISVTGYYDVDQNAAKDAAEFTGTDFISDMKLLTDMSDTLFLTVPDGLISTVWNQIKDYSLREKFIIHCSGAMSAADAFPGIAEIGAFGYSVHPLFAVSDKYHSYKELEHAYFTIEGNQEHLEEIQGLFRSFGNQVLTIQAKDKPVYHLAAAICSNHMIALLQETIDLMGQCGIEEEACLAAISPIVKSNIEHVLEAGTVASLTGPVERADVETVKKHLNCLGQADASLYKLLSAKLVSIGKIKNPDRNYKEVEELLEESK